MTVRLVDKMGDDMAVIDAMLVRDPIENREIKDRDRGRLNMLIRDKHASPFEHVVLKFLVDTPLFVARQWFRHRTQSYNEFSMRYTEVPNEFDRFFTPKEWRSQKGKPGAYEMDVISSPEQISVLNQLLYDSYQFSVDAYEQLLAEGVGKEQARMVLPVGTMTKFYTTANLRNWLNFLVLRNDSHAQGEIRDEAITIENFIWDAYPEIYEKWVTNGRPQL